MSAPAAPASRTRADIQGLRGLAVLLVIVTHAGASWLPGGFVGVDVFFVLSGFLISSLLLAEAGRTGRVSLTAFYGRRARRILPAATVVLATVAIFAPLHLGPDQVEKVNDDVTWSALFLANIHFASGDTDYFALDESPSPVQHYWSLAVEEQFYLVWPALLLLLVTARWRGRGRDDGLSPVERARSRGPLVLKVVAAVWVVSFAWSVIQTAESPTAAYFSSATRTWELATGTLLAMVAGSCHLLTSRARRLLSAAGLAAIAIAALVYDPATPFPGWQAAVPVLGTAALIAAGTGARDARRPGAGALLTVRPLTWLGDLSYSLYLWHWPVLILGAEYVGATRSLLETLVLLAVVLVVSIASYHLVENPVRRSRGVLAGQLRPLLLWPVALSLVVASTLWGNQHAAEVMQARMAGAVPLDEVETSGRAGSLASVTARIEDAVRRADEGAPIPYPLDNIDRLGADLFLFRYSCSADWEESTAELCPIGDVGAARTVVVFGDSLMGQWLPALDRIGKRQHVEFVPLVKFGCAPFDVPQIHRDTDFPSCPAFRSWATEQIRSTRPDLVLVGGRPLFHLPPDLEDPQQTWAEGVEATLRDLQPLAPLVVVSGTSPVSFVPRDCVTAPDSDMSDCTSDAEQDEVTGNAVTREISEELGVRFVDVMPLVCFEQRCPAVVDRRVIRHDASHITRTWAVEVTGALSRLLDLDQELEQGGD